MREPFDKYLIAVATLLIGMLFGFLLTAGTLQEGYGFAPLLVGPWVAWPQTGTPEVDPYARAALARRGEAALPRDLGLVFAAHVDSSGAPLDGHCEYRISGPAPAARFWTLALAAPSGAPVANAAGRYVLTSAEILRREGGGFEIALAREARAGNWLPTGEVRDFVLVVRLYETPFDVGVKLDASALPAIRKLACP